MGVADVKAEPHRRLVRAPAANRRRDSRGRRAPHSAQVGELVVRLRQRCAHHLRPASGYRHTAGAHVRSQRGRSLEQPSVSEPRCDAGMVPARHAWLGLQLHGGRRAHSHVPGLPFWRIQISPRANVDCRRLPAADDLGHGLHRSGAALRSGRLLGHRHWCVD